jgi:hypothetical protein
MMGMYRNGILEAGLPVYIVKSPFLGKRLISVPFGTVGGAIGGDIECVRLLYRDAIRIARGERCARLEIRLAHPFHVDELRSEDVTFCSGHLHHTIDLSVGEKSIWNSLHRKSVRIPIRKSLDLDIAIETANNEDGVQTFYSLFTSTRKKLCLPPPPIRFFRSLLQHLAPERLSLFIARHRGVPIAGLIATHQAGTYTLEYVGVSSGRVRNVYPYHILYWNAIRDSLQKKMRLFSFGRTSCAQTSLNLFKSRWGSEPQLIHDLVFTTQVHTNKGNRQPGASDSLKRIASLLPQSLFIRLGTILYGHMG